MIFTGNLRQSVRVTDAWEWQRDASSVLEWSSSPEEKNADATAIYLEPDPGPLSFQIGKPAHTGLREAASSREENSGK